MSSKSSIISCNKTAFCSTLLHDRLDHSYSVIVKHVVRTANKELDKPSSDELCNSSQMGKSHRLHMLPTHVDYYILLTLYMWIYEDLFLLFL